MSKIALSGSAAGSGTFTLAAPNSDSSYTLNLPQVSGGTLVATDASGNVGLGTSGPTGRISVVGTDVSGNLARIDASNGTVKCEMIPYSGLAYYGTVTNHPVVFQTNGTEKVRIDSAGNVAIGATTSPSADSKLQVTSGDIRLTVSDGVSRRLVGFNTSSSYSLGTSGGCAIALKGVSGGHQEIDIEVHNSGVAHWVTHRFGYNGQQYSTSSPGGTLLPEYKCRAWINFKGNDTPILIRNSGNVSSITDRGVGDYLINFTTSMPDAHYAAPVSTNEPSGTAGRNFAHVTGYTAASCILYVFNTSGTNIDVDYATIAVFR